MKSIDTKCVQAGYNPQNGEARVFPIYQSTTFSYETPEEMGDLFDLKKSGFFIRVCPIPLWTLWNKKITALDGSVGAMACSSGHGGDIFDHAYACVQRRQHFVDIFNIRRHI